MSSSGKGSKKQVAKGTKAPPPSTSKQPNQAKKIHTTQEQKKPERRILEFSSPFAVSYVKQMRGASPRGKIKWEYHSTTIELSGHNLSFIIDRLDKRLAKKKAVMTKTAPENRMMLEDFCEFYLQDEYFLQFYLNATDSNLIWMAFVGDEQKYSILKNYLIQVLNVKDFSELSMFFKEYSAQDDSDNVSISSVASERNTWTISAKEDLHRKKMRLYIKVSWNSDVQKELEQLSEKWPTVHSSFQKIAWNEGYIEMTSPVKSDVDEYHKALLMIFPSMHLPLCVERIKLVKDSKPILSEVNKLKVTIVFKKRGLDFNGIGSKGIVEEAIQLVNRFLDEKDVKTDVLTFSGRDKGQKIFLKQFTIPKSEIAKTVSIKEEDGAFKIEGKREAVENVMKELKAVKELLIVQQLRYELPKNLLANTRKSLQERLEEMQKGENGFIFTMEDPKPVSGVVLNITCVSSGLLDTIDKLVRSVCPAATSPIIVNVPCRLFIRILMKKEDVHQIAAKYKAKFQQRAREEGLTFKVDKKHTQDITRDIEELKLEIQQSLRRTQLSLSKIQYSVAETLKNRMMNETQVEMVLIRKNNVGATKDSYQRTLCSWVWIDDEKVEQEYSFENAEKIEQGYQQKERYIEIGLSRMIDDEKQNYYIIYDYLNGKHIQQNSATQFQRNMRRKEEKYTPPRAQDDEKVTIELVGRPSNISKAKNDLFELLNKLIGVRKLTNTSQTLRKLRKLIKHMPDVEVIAMNEGDSQFFALNGIKEKLDAAENIILRAESQQPTSMKYPEHWATQTENCRLVNLYATNREHISVSARVKHTLPQCRIIKVERIQNQWLWKKYVNQRELIEMKNGGDANERYLFHGTKSTPPKQVYEDEVGFDMRHSQQGMWGRGCYFANNASYSGGGYAHTKQSTNTKQMFLAKVAVGDAIKMNNDNSITMPPVKNTGVDIAHSIRYDAINSPDGNIFIIYENSRAYPEYLITFIE